MPPLHYKVIRQQQKQEAVIPGARSLHRGIHFNQNKAAVQRYMANPGKKRNDFRDLLVHHQKVNEELKDVYSRTAKLTKENMTLEERKEESWKAFERIGGKRPKEHKKHAQHLADVSAAKKTHRGRLELEAVSGGDAIDQRAGSAIEDARKKRVGDFVERQIKRSRKLRRMGDPTPLKQSGSFDRNTNTLRVFNKTRRQVDRSVAQDKRVGAVKERRGKGRSMWDVRGGEENINRPAQQRIRDASSDWSFGAGKKRGNKGGRR